MNLGSLNKKLSKRFGPAVRADFNDGKLLLYGALDSWDDIISACNMCVQKDKSIHVVNKILLRGVKIPEMKIPALRDKALEGERPDVLIIGGGISGCSIARELSKWKLDIILIEKESDIALAASGRNDGEVHPGVDLGRGSLKQKYVLLGNAMFDKICKELDVPFKRCGQYVGFTQGFLKPAVHLYAAQRRKIGVKDSRVISRRQLLEAQPNMNPDVKFALYNSSAGTVCPYGLSIAYAENAVQNRARIFLNTAAISMECENGKIRSLTTNRGKLYPKIVINAAGVWADKIAEMANDGFFSIHPRRGTNSILDKKEGGKISAVSSIKQLSIKKSHTKGGGVIHTVHGNLLVGPDAVECFERENTATGPDSIERVFKKQKETYPGLSQRDIITYFTGVRAPTFEEDFIIEKGRKTENIIHCAGIQSPGLTTAPAVALEIEKMCLAMLPGSKRNESFNPIRKAPPVLRELSDEQRNALIKQNPDYGIIVCRCEEISRGEIIDALKSPLPVATLDGIKKRVRPGMGRCQGGFCSPAVIKIIADYLGVPPYEVTKNGGGSLINFGETKAPLQEADS